jgi:hypothetical protein
MLQWLEPKIKLLSLSILAAALAAASYPNCAFSQSRVTGYQTVGRDIAINSAIDILVYPGRASAIDFSSTDEALAYVLIADPSKVVFSTDAQLASGRAKTVFLRPIQALNFPGATTATITNLLNQNCRFKRETATLQLQHRSYQQRTRTLRNSHRSRHPKNVADCER